MKKPHKHHEKKPWEKPEVNPLDGDENDPPLHPPHPPEEREGDEDCGGENQPPCEP